MKQTIAILMATMLMAVSAMAQAEIVKQKAKQQRDINNQQQGIAPSAPNTQPGPGSYSAAPAPGTVAAPQGISSAQQALIDRLQNDLTFIKTGATATTDQKQHVSDDLASLAKGANKPSKPALSKLSADLAAILAEKPLAAKDMAQLAKNLNVVVNCGFMTSAKAQTFIAQAQTVLKTAGVGEPAVQLIGTDLKAIVMEIQKSKAKLYQ